jgi:hypothetical protein
MLGRVEREEHVQVLVTFATALGLRAVVGLERFDTRCS